MRNKEKQKQYARKHYLKNKDKVKKSAAFYKKISKKRNKDFVIDYLLKHPCIDCSESDIVVLDFDHVKDDKIMNIADAINNGWSIEKLKTEIEKCVIRCANCHRRITHLRRHSSLRIAGKLVRSDHARIGL